MKLVVLVTTVTAGLLLAPVPAQAWNSIGHLAVAKLAYDRLSDGEKAKLLTLLKSHPHYETYLAAGRPAEVSEAEWAIMRSAVWPDWVRPRERDMRGPGVVKYHRGEDHYINIPLIDPKDKDFFAGKTLVSPDLANVVSALKQRANDIATRTADPADKAVALCWLFHLVGDIHQPMHAVAYFSSDKAFVQGDIGGNKFGIKVNGRKEKLHAYWDNLFGDDPNYGDDSGDRQARLYAAAVKAAEGLRGLKLPDADQDKLTKNVTFASWSVESFELARSIAYQKADGSGIFAGAEVKFKGPFPANSPEAGPEYANLARATAEIRVVMAGQRLAERLQKLLAK